MTVKVVQTVGSTVSEIPNTVIISGNSAFINLSSVPVNNTWLRIDIVSNSITDLNGNAVQPMAVSMMVLASY
jgi:hypothetical protein